MRKMAVTTERVVESPTAAAPAPVCKPRRQPTPATTAPKKNDLINPASTSSTRSEPESWCISVASGKPSIIITASPPATPMAME